MAADKIETEELGGGFQLRLEDTPDYTTQATLVRPNGDEETIVGGSESECPEDMIWCRDLGTIFRQGLDAGKAIGKREGYMMAVKRLRALCKANQYVVDPAELLRALEDEAPGEPTP